MKALVTGANGFTGSHLVKALERHGASVVGLVRRTSNCDRLNGSGLERVYGDIADREAIATAMQDVDTVFHLAAYVDLGLVDETEMARVNLEGTRAVLETAQSQPTPPRLLYCSTIGIYGDTRGTVVDEAFQRQQTDFSSAYDRTKYRAQELVDRAAAEGLKVVSVMPSGIFGPDDPHFGPAIKLFLSGWLKGWPGGDRMTGVVHVEDLVEAMILAVERGTPGEHYILSASELSLRDMFAILSRETGIPVPAEIPQPLVRAIGNILDPIGRLFKWNPPLGRERIHYLYDRCVRVSGAKAKRELGWQPRSIEATLQDILDQLRSTN
ncbi:NAD-dependent epimerase/dehydratase family protein [Synechococcus sp. PCC 7336]|uniref:NAD-dependent epimerase/dehydratase family protein n=1 Tax=Synechococcus sp. PCC 7336 TaxID=195250 RepID=UPI00034A4E1D|nr:NAD-dependent epimerase/dehydratase family protein [Synechococcus sp. PCC 7336]